jgi:outer membrane protein TolC
MTFAAEQRRLSLSECVRLALENNPAVNSLEWQLRAADAARTRSGAERRPRLDLNLDLTESERAQRIAPPSYFGEPIFTDQELLVAEMRLTAPLYRGGQLANRELVAEKRASGARATLTTGRQQLVLRVVDVYTRTQEQRARIRALEASLAALEANRSVVATLDRKSVV